VLPGVAQHDTITRFHTATYLEHCKAVNCVMEGTPLHKDPMEGVNMIGGIWAVNTVLDEHRRSSFLNPGPLEASLAEWLKACGDKDVVVIPEEPYVVPMRD